ncbi:MAG: superinfection exclusion B family protein [Candidatus Cybelea sp.]
MSLDSFVKPFFELLKQPLRYSIAIGMVVTVVLFSPDSIMNKMGLLKYRDEGKPYFGAILLVCIAFAIASGIGAAGKKINNYRFCRSREKRLRRLSIEEKQVLRGYIEGETRSLYFNVTSGVINGLAAEHIVYRASSLSNPQYGMAAFAYNIQPWAWDYLNEHRDLLGP